MVQLSHLCMTTGKTIALTRGTSVHKVMSLLFNTLSGFVWVEMMGNFVPSLHGKHGETVENFIFWGSIITGYGDCSHEIKIYLLLGRKVMTNLDSILKSRHYFANKGPSS